MALFGVDALSVSSLAPLPCRYSIDRAFRCVVLHDRVCLVKTLSSRDRGKPGHLMAECNSSDGTKLELGGRKEDLALTGVVFPVFVLFCAVGGYLAELLAW